MTEEKRSNPPILMDNSTYFSFKSLVTEARLDASALYNAASFLECLVVADEVLFSPTSAWSPDSSDPLFKLDGPCRQISVDEISSEQLAEVFSGAITAGINDLNDREMRRLLGVRKKAARRASDLMISWRKSIRESPHNFMDIYSGAVFRTDEGSGKILSRFDTTVSPRDASYRHMAQYLLRTNSALEFAKVGDTAVTPYHPHSHRVPYVVARLRRLSEQSEALASTLMREAEDLITEEVKGLRNETFLRAWGAFSDLGSEAPLVLAVALSGSREPAEVLKRTLELRETKEAKRYRRWVANLLHAATGGDTQKQIKAEAELQLARQVLATELKKLYGKNSGSMVQATSSIMSAVDLEDLAGGNFASLALGGAKEALGGAQRIRQFIVRARARKKIALLIRLARGRKPEMQLCDLVKRVLGQPISDSDQENFSKLRRDQAATLKQLQAKKKKRSTEISSP